MSAVSKVMTELKKKGTEQTRKTFLRHGAPKGNFFGVKVADLKVIAKKIKGDQELAMELYDTGNSDAMYLAGIVADGAQMSKSQLNKWAKEAPWYMIAEYTVPGVAHENEHARDLAMKWIKSKNERIASAGWSTYSGIVATRDDKDLDHKEIKSLLSLIEKNIDKSPNRVRYTINGFVIGVGGYVKPLEEQAKATARKIGKVDVEMGDTACKVPLATEYIEKVLARGGKKRKTIKR